MTNRDKVNEMARYCAVHDCRDCGIREECHHAGIRWKPELTWSGLLKEYPSSFGLVYSALCKITSETDADKPTDRADILHAAEKCVCGDREADYGNPEDSFKAIASMWNSYLYAIGLVENHTDEWKGLKPKDIAAMMVLFKIARVATGHGKLDNWIDAAGYAANGGECEASISKTEGGT